MNKFRNMIEIEVKGHSGCQIDVVNEQGVNYVYKSTTDPKYLRRLILQAEKQRAAGRIEHQHIRVPEVYELDVKPDATIIKMQYIYSKNFIEFFEQVGFEQVDYLIGALKHFIEYEISKSALKKISPDVFQQKFLDIRKKIKGNSFYHDNKGCIVPIIQDIIDRSKVVFDNLDDMIIPIGICHGDLTFSNILFNGNNYYLIDFLDSFIETPLQDIVKIRQDTAFRWSQLMYTKPYDAVRLQIICDKIDCEIDRYFSSKYQWYADNYLPVQLMNILRILPYAHEERVIDHLVRVLKSLLNEIENGKCIIKNNEEIKYESVLNKRTLIMPIAANKPEYARRMPRVFQMSEDGTMLCIKALQSVNLKKIDKVYITILRSLDVRYSISEMLRLQFQIKGIDNAEVLVLDEPTASQPETIYRTVCKKNINGSIFIKDADCCFSGESTDENSIVIYPLEQLDWVNPQNKSYVNIDDMYYITNIIEKRVVSHYFTAGGYCFESAQDYCRYYKRFEGNNNLYLSHIIYSMLLDKKIFRPIMAETYEDFDFKFEM